MKKILLAFLLGFASALGTATAIWLLANKREVSRFLDHALSYLPSQRKMQLSISLGLLGTGMFLLLLAYFLSWRERQKSKKKEFTISV
jgi:hypothetical protein